MKIGLIDNDLCTRPTGQYPNLALMKISSYHKRLGHNVALINIDEFSDVLFKPEYDKVYLAKVFSDTYTPKYIQNKNIIIGGSGFYFDKAERLPEYIEHIMPDYSLYDIYKNKIHKKSIRYFNDYSIGFTTRGCIRRCAFCINKNSSRVERHSPISEFLDIKRPKIMLWDDNILAYPKCNEIFDELNKTGKPFVFKQGLDFRLLNEKKIKMLLDANYESFFHFAFDNIKDKDLIVSIFERWNKIKKINAGNMMFYVFMGFDYTGKYDSNFFKEDIRRLIERLEILFKYKAYPYITIHQNAKLSPYFEEIKLLRNIINMPIRISNKTVREALLQHKNQNICDWLELLGYKSFLENGFFAKDIINI